jgi:hypothetical protein
MAEVGQRCEDRFDHGQERAGDEQHPRPRVGQHVGILLGRQQRVERHRHNARPDRAKEQRREIDGVEHDQRDPLLPPHVEPAEQVCDAVRRRLQFAVGEAARGVDQGKLAAAARRDVAVDEVDGRVMGTRIGRAGRLRRPHIHRPPPPGLPFLAL